MATWIEQEQTQTTELLLGAVLSHCLADERVQFLVPAGCATAVVQRLRVALSRSRKRNQKAGKKTKEFTLRHEVYPYTQSGRRHDCIVMWVERSPYHLHREILTDLLER